MWSDSICHHMSQREAFLVDDVCILASSTRNWMKLDLFSTWLRNLRLCLTICAIVMFFTPIPSSSALANHSLFVREVPLYVSKTTSILWLIFPPFRANDLLYKEHSINDCYGIVGHLFSWGDIFVCKTVARTALFGFHKKRIGVPSAHGKGLRGWKSTYED